MAENTDETIHWALKNAIRAKDVSQAVTSLTHLAGVGIKMASAILTAMEPERYTVLDFRALEALGMSDKEDLDVYAEYVQACRALADKYGVTLRDFDRANWRDPINEMSGDGSAAHHT